MPSTLDDKDYGVLLAVKADEQPARDASAIGFEFDKGSFLCEADPDTDELKVRDGERLGVVPKEVVDSERASGDVLS